MFYFIEKLSYVFREMVSSYLRLTVVRFSQKLDYKDVQSWRREVVIGGEGFREAEGVLFGFERMVAFRGMKGKGG